MGWNIGFIHIYLISVILHVYSGYDLCYNTLMHDYITLFHIRISR
jgi:hypothetical protein